MLSAAEFQFAGCLGKEEECLLWHHKEDKELSSSAYQPHKGKTLCIIIKNLASQNDRTNTKHFVHSTSRLLPDDKHYASLSCITTNLEQTMGKISSDSDFNQRNWAVKGKVSSSDVADGYDFQYKV